MVDDAVMNQKRFKRIAIFLFVLLLTSILIIIYITPLASNYEIDIYGVYPWYFWLLFISALTLGCALIMFSKSKQLISYGFIFVVITNVILLGLQFFRGYFFYGGGDIFTHIGFSKDMLEFGNISSTNFYPFQHVLIVNLNRITSISIKTSSRLLSIIFYLLFVISLYIFLRKYSLSKFKYCLVLGTLLILGSEYITPIPNILAFLFLPSVLFFLKKIYDSPSKIRFNLLLFIVVLSVIFFHPITSLYLLSILIIFKITNLLSFKFWNISFDIKHLNKTILLSTGCWILWHMGFSSIRRGIRRTVYSIFHDPSLNPRAEEYTQTMRMFDIHFLDIFRKFTFDYGIVSILFLIVIIYLAYMTYDNRKIKKFSKQKEVLFLTSAAFLFVIWSTINFFADFVTFTRVFKLVILFSFLLLGFTFSFNISSKVNRFAKNKNKHLFVLSLLVIFILLISLIGLYPSPASFSSNRQITHQENEGISWFFSVQNDDMIIWEEGIRQYRWVDFIYGRRGDERPDNIRREANVRNHFGYQEHERMGENYSGYFIKTYAHMITYRNIFSEYEEYWRFNDSDYQRFDRDDSVNKIYDNGFFSSYYIEEVDDQ